VEGAAIVAGRLEARPISFDLPIAILDQELVFHIEGGALAIEPQADGSFRGVFAGGIDRQVLVDLVNNAGIADEVAVLVEDFLAMASDLDPDGDGACEQIAVTFAFTAAPAFYYAD
jgi:hypothetical protein